MNGIRSFFRSLIGKAQILFGIFIFFIVGLNTIGLFTIVRPDLQRSAEAELNNAAKAISTLVRLYLEVGDGEINLINLEQDIQRTIGTNTSYFIIDTQGTLILHETHRGQNISGLTDSQGNRYMEKLLVEAQSVDQYTCLRRIFPGDEEVFPGKEKAGFFSFYPKLRWVIVTYRDLKDIHEFYQSMVRIFAWVAVISFFVIFILIYFILRNVLRPIYALSSITKVVNQGDLTQRLHIYRTDEVGDTAQLFNDVLESFSSVLKQIQGTVTVLSDSIQELSSSSQEIASTSNQQAAAVKEIVSTMEDSDELSKSIALKIDEVTKIAGSTKDVVDNGFQIIQNSLGKMEEIRSSNSETINGIRSLGEKIENIWDIVNIINGIADQTKIIAFNAELEASAAGESGKNFQIVAAEIRRLADSTVSSTNEIKTKITEIQHSSDNLIIASEEGTEKINTGWQLSKDLQKLFEDILSSSDISATSAEQIRRSINQQVAAFEQIVITLKQVSSGIDSFVDATKGSTSASSVLKQQSDDLETLLSRFTVGE